MGTARAQARAQAPPPHCVRRCALKRDGDSEVAEGAAMRSYRRAALLAGRVAPVDEGVISRAVRRGGYIPRSADA